MRIDLTLEVLEGLEDPSDPTGLTNLGHDRLVAGLRTAGFEIAAGPSAVAPTRVRLSEPERPRK
jgi:hypothetical protein